MGLLMTKISQLSDKLHFEEITDNKSNHTYVNV